jgi:hypothetical protein
MLALSSLTSSTVSSPAKALSSVRKSIQWHSCRSRIARTIPVAIFGLGFLIVIEAAKAQERSQAHLVLGQSLDDYGQY